MLAHGWHSRVVFGTHSAAVAAAVLYGLDVAGFAHALGNGRHSVSTASEFQSATATANTAGRMPGIEHLPRLG
jgi:2-methylcitrate dehydratase PrpD